MQITVIVANSQLGIVGAAGRGQVIRTRRADVGARDFYGKVGVTPGPSKIFYRVEDTGTGLQFSR